MSVSAVGERAPQFKTRNQHGQEVSLASLAGRKVVLVFFPYAFTGICTSEMCELRDRLDQFNALGAQVLAISTDTMFALRVFAEQEKLGFDLLTDFWPHGEISRAYGVFDETQGCAVRGSFVLNAEGVITWSVVNRIGEARDIAEHLQALA